jgi:5'-methylthioadenosine phosphorylase
MKTALLSGTSLLRSNVFSDWPTRELDTQFGRVSVRERGRVVLLNRHGPAYLPPHSINHRANIRALADLGCADVVSINSVGSLRAELPPGTLLSCSDYISFRPATFSDTEMRALAPLIANNLIPRIAESLTPVPPQGKVYVQTPGPRFETPAEVRVLQQWGGDVVGMTAASEADLCREIGLNYNSLCMVDNYANGLGGPELSPETFREQVRANQERIDELFRLLLGLFC